MKDKIETCNTSLQLGLGVGNYAPLAVDEDRIMKEKDKPMVCLGLSFDHLGPKEEEVSNGYHQMISNDQFEEDYANKKRKYSHHNKNAGVGGSDGKKLRLSKEQSNTLEENFNIQNTPSLAQRQALADKLNLKPRQVEVWFQNRRARTKLKQTEVNCQVLKKCCESLRGENKRLKKELQDLRSVIKIIQPSKPFYIQANSKATMLTICPFEEVQQNSNK